MVRRSLIVGVLLAASVLTGCGDGSTAKNAMDAKFRRIDYELSTIETITSSYNMPHFARATRQYIALVREYADLLGPDEAKRRLRQKAYELGSFCLPCVATLDDEASRY